MAEPYSMAGGALFAYSDRVSILLPMGSVLSSEKNDYVLKLCTWLTDINPPPKTFKQ